MADVINRTLCDYCTHRKVCTYKNDFISVVETLQRSALIKNIADYDFVKDVSVSCRYFST